MTGENLLLAVSGYGSRRLKCEEIQHGISVVPGEETSTSTGRNWNPTIVSSGSFSVVVIHSTYKDFVDLNDWLKVYVDRVSTGKVGPMRITCPARRFDKVAIPSRGIRFGREATEFFWRQTLGFTGTSSALDLASTEDLTKLSAAYTATYFEPGGSPGDYLSSYAIASVGDPLLPSRSESLYNAPAVNPFVGYGGQRYS